MLFILKEMRETTQAMMQPDLEYACDRFIVQVEKLKKENNDLSVRSDYMSNDLINRQETYKELIDGIDYLRDKDYELYCEIGYVIQCCIENIPTTYDIDKVVEELEENASRYTKKYVTPYGNNVYRDVKAISIHNAIEIVKHGYIRKDVSK